MAKYAYKDPQRKDVIYSSQAIKEDRNTAFYCPNPECNAKLYICALDGSKSAYFRAKKPEYKHIINCPFGSSNSEFDENKFDESKFVFDNAIDNLLCVTTPSKEKEKSTGHNTGEPQLHPPRTIRQIYSMCKSMPVNSKYGDKEIEEMLLDDRSEYRYPKGCFGIRIIETIVKKRIYDDNKKQIYLAAPMNSQKYTFVLEFNDSNTYQTIRSEIYNNRDKIIVIAGNWKSSGTYNSFVTTVYGRKQVAIIKNNK